MTLRFCLWMFVALAAVSIAIKFAGEFAAEKVGVLPGFDKALIEQHEQSADQATTGVFFMGIAALVSLFVSRNGKPTPTWSLGLLGLLALITFALMARTANFGGHIRHPEIRPEVSELRVAKIR